MIRYRCSFHEYLRPVLALMVLSRSVESFDTHDAFVQRGSWYALCLSARVCMRRPPSLIEWTRFSHSLCINLGRG